MLALTAIALLVATALTLQRKGSRIVGSNGVPPSASAVVVPPNARACQDAIRTPEQATSVRVTAATFGRRGGRVRLETPNGGRGPAARIAPNRVLDLRLPEARVARLCISNRGAVRVALAGIWTPREQGARIDGRAVPGAFSATYAIDRSETWGDRAGAIIDRVGFAKGLPGGSATGVVLIGLLLGALLGALVTSWRAMRP